MDIARARPASSPCLMLPKFLVPGILVMMLMTVGARAVAQQLSLGLVPDGLALTAGIVAAGASELLPTNPLPPSLDAASINSFDTRAYFSYSRGLDVASDVLQYVTAAFPLVMAFSMDNSQAAAAGVVYVETLSFAYFSRSLGKFLLPRARPWTYFPVMDSPPPDPQEGNESFPSGHATLAFASAAFGVTTFAICFPDSPWLVPFVIADLGLASCTAALRVLAGMHFMSDVIAGAVLGAVIGVALPLLHATGASSTAEEEVSTRWAVPLLSVSY